MLMLVDREKAYQLNPIIKNKFEKQKIIKLNLQNIDLDLKFLYVDKSYDPVELISILNLS